MDYTDYSREKEVYEDVRRTGEPSFTSVLHLVLETAERDGLDDVISWKPHGRAFCVHDAEELLEKVLKL